MTEDKWTQDPTEDSGTWTIRKSPTPKSELDIHHGTLNIHTPNPMPNWWFRMWQRLFLGFVWRKL